MNKLWLFLFFINTIGFSQNLEETIYVAAETFITNKNDRSLAILSNEEKSFKKLVKTQDEQLALVFLLSHKGYYLDEQSKLEDAIITFEDAVKRFNDNDLSKLSDFDIIENCLIPLGNLYTKTDNFTNALNTINQYIFLAKKDNNTKHLISGNINLAKLYQTINRPDDHKKVIEIIDKTLAIPNISNSKKAKLLDIKTKSLIELNQTIQPLNNSKTSSRFNKDKNEYLVQLKKGNYSKALVAFNKAKNHLNKGHINPRYLARFYFQEAQLYYKLNDKTKALKSINEAIKTLLPNFNQNGLPNKEDLYAENIFIDIFDLYAEIETNPELTLQCFDLIFHVSSLLRNNWTSQKTKILNVSSNRNRSEKCINILFNTYKQTKNKALLFRAFQYSESYKTSIIKEIAQKKLRLEQHPNDSLLIKEFHLIREQERLTNLLIKEELEANSSNNINNLGIKINEVSRKLKILQHTISTKYPKTKHWFSLNDLQSKLLTDHTILVEYFYGKFDIYQFIISNNNIILNQIQKNAKVEKTITNFNSLFNEPATINNNIPNFTTQAFNIYKLLNFDAINTYNNIIVIPDSYLNFTPFEALLTQKTKTTSFSKMPFVVKTQNIAYNSNAFIYLNEIKQQETNTVLGFFPVFKNTNQPLTYSVDEAKFIESKMASSIFMNKEATKINFIKNASNHSILHLSTHASSNNGIKPATISFYDNNLSVDELYSLNLNPELVVLSACETGVGKSRKAEGAMSIARGFQYAGAKNILFSLWQINDLSTSQLIQSFYKHYNKNKSAFTSNHLSKIEYLENKSISNVKKSPYYWSAFVYYGKIGEPIPDYSLIYISFSIIIIILLVLLTFKLKNYGRKTSKFSSK